MPIDLTKVFSAVTEVPKDAIGEFAVFTNEIEDFKNIRELKIFENDLLELDI